MRRRKLLISIGALGAGGTAAFGTEAFTSVEAERSVDVTVAGDESAFLAIQPLSGNNANEYVSTEDDDTVALDLDDGAGTDGSGVNQDAVTQVEDLFKIINQGTQPTSVFFEDDSDAVTFRVTRSTDTSTKGPSGESLEGADNSVELNTGEQVAVGITVDTLNNQVSGELITDVTIRAEAGASAPEQNIPEPQYVVDGSGDDPNTFADLSSAITSGEIEAGAVVGIDASVSITESSSIDISTNDVTVTGFNGRPTIDRDVQDDAFIEASGNGVTIRNLEITEDVTGAGFGGERSLLASGSGVTIDGVRVENQDSEKPKGNPTIATIGEDTTITNCESINAPISANGASGSLTLTNNYIEDALTEGIFSSESTDSDIDFTVENNEVENHDINDENSKEIKIVNDPDSVNGETGQAAQIESLLTENSVNSVQLDGDSGTQVTPDIIGSDQQFASVREAVKPGTKGSPGGSALVALFEDGTFRFEDTDTVEFPQNAIVASASPSSRPTIEYRGGSGSNGNVRFNSGATMEGIRIEIRGGSSGNEIKGGAPVFEAIGGGVEFRDLEMEAFQNELVAPVGSYLSINDDSGSNAVVIEDNLFQASNGTPVATGHAKSSGGGAIIRNNQYEDGASIAGSFGSGDDLTINDNTVADPSKAEAFFTFPAEADAGDLEMKNNDFATPSSSEEAIKLLEVPATVNGQKPSSAQDAADILANANPGAVPVEVQDGDDSNGLAE